MVSTLLKTNYMPELPEVESVRQLLSTGEPSLPGAVVNRVEVLRNTVIGGGQSAHQLQHEIVGAVFHEIFRHGKYLFFRLRPARGTKSLWMAIHLRMRGRLFLVPAATAVSRHTRFVLYLDRGLALRFDDPRAFGRVWLIADPAEVISTLGPDALELDYHQFVQRLAGHRRQIKPLLLDQSVIAGLGNIYVDESLFRAGLHPLRTAATLTDEERRRLYGAVHAVLEQAVRCKGANIAGVFEAGNFPVAVYGRTGLPCDVCGSPIVKQKVGQRGTHLCLRCQPVG